MVQSLLESGALSSSCMVAGVVELCAGVRLFIPRSPWVDVEVRIKNIRTNLMGTKKLILSVGKL
jgi:hypothetical protein